MSTPMLTPERRAKLTAWLEEAEDQLQRVTTGQMEASISQGNAAQNSSVSFQGASAETIRGRIAELRSELGLTDRGHRPIELGNAW